MPNPDYSALVARQREYFLSGCTRTASWRKEQLLGGKNPTIVHSTANLEVAAHRIAYGRYLNSGHICTAPDHVLVWPEVKDAFVRHLAETIRKFYGDDPKLSPDYGRVINRRNFDRLVGLLGSGKAVVGGQTDPNERYIAPTVLVDVSADSPIMQEEVFGPILPVLEIDSVEAVIQWVNNGLRPLGLYVFTEDLSVAERILDATESGDAAINDCTIHPLIPELPFGDVGNSGMANTTAGGVSRRSSMPAASCTTTPGSTPVFATLRTRSTPMSARSRTS